jgi:NAD(P)-dependent dehydrogenase (short-subunit alcohol dehydrogenase family)
MAGEFIGKVVLVTGASGNLGRTVTRRFATEGAKLVLVERNSDKLATLVSELGGDPSFYLPVAADLGNEEAVDRVIAETHERFGGLDVLAHTVGGFEAGKPVHESGLDVLERMLNLNVRPIYLVGGRVAKYMVEHGTKGKIVFVLARSALKGGAKSAAYTASKAAAQRIMESMSAELKDLGINVNAVLPSTIDSPANRKDMPNADPSKWVTPDNVADAIYFLASDRASALNGVSLEVSGRV